MLYSLEQVLVNRRPLITVRHDVSLLDALRLLIERRLGQIPVVDERGRLAGVVSQQAILGIYFLTDGQVSLFDLAAVDAMDPAHTLSLADDLLAAVDRLANRGVYAVVITDDAQPVGILTGKDMSVLFHSLFEGLLLVERIEGRLRSAIAAAFPDDDAYSRALIAAFGADKRDPARPQRSGRNLGLTDMVYFVRDDDNWPMFQPLLGNRDYFRLFTDRVRFVRNEMAHFAGNIDVLKMDTLRRAVTWLEQRLALASSATTNTAEQTAQVQTLARVIGGRKPPVCVEPQAPLRQALRTMIENRFGQLPVVDEHGCLLGMLSQQSILRTYYHTDGALNLLDLPVTHCTETVTTLHMDDDLFTAADILAQPGQYAPVVVEGDRPIGILTGKDMTRFFRSLFEGIILVERIETRLSEYIAQAFPDATALNEAAKRVFGPGPNRPEYSARNPEYFTLADRISFIADDDIWPCYEQALGSREVFMHLADRARRVRNALMHFRGSLSYSEQDALRKAQSWLGQRPMIAAAAALPAWEEYNPARTTGNNPYPQVMARKLRTLPAGEDEEGS
jgi:CBS domain-containing protein